MNFGYSSPDFGPDPSRSLWRDLNDDTTGEFIFTLRIKYLGLGAVCFLSKLKALIYFLQGTTES